MPERVEVSNNTFDGNRYGITGGDNLTATGNTISNSDVGLKNVDGRSTVTGTRFINNDVDYIHSNVAGAATATKQGSLALIDVLDMPDATGMLVVDDTARSHALSGNAGTHQPFVGRISGGLGGIGVSGSAEQPGDADIASLAAQ